MDADKRREIARKGGRAAHEKGTAHRFTSEEARAAGQKGGRRAHEKGTAHKFTSQEAREAGRRSAANMRNGGEGPGEPAHAGMRVPAVSEPMTPEILTPVREAFDSDSEEE
jgi:general stress protein YciG